MKAKFFERIKSKGGISIRTGVTINDRLTIVDTNVEENKAIQVNRLYKNEEINEQMLLNFIEEDFNEAISLFRDSDEKLLSTIQMLERNGFVKQL